MSWLTVFARHVGLGPVLNLVEAGEAAARAATPAGTQADIDTAVQAVKAAAPNVAQTAVADLGTLAGQVVDAAAAKVLPPGVSNIAVEVTGNLLAEVEAAATKWLRQQFAGNPSTSS